MKTRAMALLAATAALGGCAAERAPREAQADAAAAQELQARFDEMLAGWEALDGQRLDALLAREDYLTSFDFDLEGKPTRMPTREDAKRYIDQMLAQAKAAEGKLGIVRRGTECRATSTFGACAGEFEVTMTGADGARVVQPTRATATFVRRADGWKLSHWHSSLSAAPPAAAPDAAPLPAAQWDTGAVRLQDVPGVPGVQGALLWEDPATGASASVTAFAPGAQFPAHFHSHGLHVYVLQGTFTWTEKDGTVHEVKAGGYTYQPGRAVHTTASRDGCRFLQVSDGKFDLVPVDEQGNAQEPLVPAWPPAAR